MNHEIEDLLIKVSMPRFWDYEPVFCFTSDIDWASESVLDKFFNQLNLSEIKLTTFVTHHSAIIENQYLSGKIQRGIHPNFLEGSSHGKGFEEIVETCIKFAPEARGFRSHRLFDVTDITHLLKNKYNFKYVSNLGTIMKTKITPIIHESGLLHYPIFFEDGTHLYNKLDLNIRKFHNYFHSPGIKIICFHPMNFVFNSPTMSYMRNIKDTLSREAFNNINFSDIDMLKNKTAFGIADSVKMIFDFVLGNNYKILSLEDIYHETIK